MEWEAPDERGFVHLWRCIEESEVWEHGALVVQEFLWIVLNASGVDGYQPHEGLTLKRGQGWTSYPALRKALRFRNGRGYQYPSLDAIKRGARRLKEMGMIEIEDAVQVAHKQRAGLSSSEPNSAPNPALKGIIVTVCNYNKWNPIEKRTPHRTAHWEANQRGPKTNSAPNSALANDAITANENNDVAMGEKETAHQTAHREGTPKNSAPNRAPNRALVNDSVTNNENKDVEDAQKETAHRTAHRTPHPIKEKIKKEKISTPPPPPVPPEVRAILDDWVSVHPLPSRTRLEACYQVLEELHRLDDHDYATIARVCAWIVRTKVPQFLNSPLKLRKPNKAGTQQTFEMYLWLHPEFKRPSAPSETDLDPRRLPYHRQDPTRRPG